MPVTIESPYRIEPCLLDSIPLDIADRIAELTSATELLGARLHPHTAAGLADLVRIMMDYADTPRQGDLDGPGNLSQQALIEFIQWFLQVCIDQASFMTGLFEFDRLLERLKFYTQYREMKAEAFLILEKVLMMSEMPRGEAARVTGLKERSARILLADLLRDGILASATPKGPVSLRFTSDTAEILFPRLFAES